MAHAHATTADDEAGHGSLGSYLTGFGLAVVLTLIPFVLVMTGALTGPSTLVVIFAAAIVQILVHLHYFLHLDSSSGQRWNMLAFLFTLTVIVLLVGGSIWIMYNLAGRTMIDQGRPPSTGEMM
ncbi:MAG TPA: cytochrome o ubiquinol oxidase subunit IV [Acetobacteraceae bacterium]|nr:cytochrome o ubiquinol oxidase subunit IV [Acetobacteraceae bacterium]